MAFDRKQHEFRQAMLFNLPEGQNQPPPDGMSFDKAYQDQKPAGYNLKRVTRGAGKDGMTVSKARIPFYEKVAPKTVTKVVQQSKPAAPKPKPKPKPKKPIEYSPEIQQAKDRVNAFEGDQTSPWEQAQANVQSSFIKSSSSDTGSKEYDFSSNSFNPNESSEPNEQAQAAQNQLQNYISKYSNFKSSSN